MPNQKFAKCFCIPQRVILSIMGFLALVNAYTMRVCISIAITTMVVKPNATSGKPGQAVCVRDPKDFDIDYINTYVSLFDSDKKELYNWSQALQGTILSSFYWGYVITHVPGGILAEKFGGKWTLSLGILSTAIFTLLTPMAVLKGGYIALIALRVLMGLGEGTTFPALSVLLSHWIPLEDRSKLGAFVFGGGQIGSVLGSSISGFLLDYFGTWEPVFYFFGLLAILWFVIFTVLCYSDPSEHPFIKDSEKEYLEGELSQVNAKNLEPTPWKAILTSGPMLALITAQIGHDYGFYIMVSYLPKYMSDVLLVSIKENGIYSSLPSLMMWLISVGSGFLCDWLITKKYMRITFARKFWTILAAVGPAIFILGASYAGCDKLLVVALFTVAMGLMGTYYAGMKLNPLDLSPNYAGTVMAITNGIGAITGLLVPLIVGAMTPHASMNEWRLVFWIAFAVFVVTSIVYGIWASGEVQLWNEPSKYRAYKAEKAGNKAA